MVDAEQNPEETQTTPSALEVLDRIEAEKAAQVAGAEKPTEAAESKDTVVNIVNVVDASQPAEAEAAKPAEAEAAKPDPEPEPKSAKERDIELLKAAVARCDEIKQEVRVHDKAIRELNDEYVKLVRDIKHARERTRLPLHVLNKEQAKITANERAQRFADADTLRRLGAMRAQPRAYPPKFKIEK